MYGHVLAHFINDENKSMPRMPFLCLTVSGGHTQIVLIKDYLDMQVLGTTIDDAAGEAFDKAAKMLGFPYPGGPLIDKFARRGDENKFKFSKPKVPGYDFSFSGLKTSILYFLQKQEKENSDFIKENLEDLCASIQKTIVDILIKQLEEVVNDLGIKEVAIAGGVSANSELRNRIIEKKDSAGWNVYIPRFEYCTDNAAMIAITGKFMFEKNLFTNQSVTAMARMPFNAK